VMVACNEGNSFSCFKLNEASAGFTVNVGRLGLTNAKSEPADWERRNGGGSSIVGLDTCPSLRNFGLNPGSRNFSFAIRALLLLFVSHSGFYDTSDDASGGVVSFNDKL
jgi:hypothetical protein